MVNKLIVLGLVMLCIISFIGAITIQEDNIKEETLYQGPVPEGYDLQYFRETGITRRINGHS